MIFTCAGVYAKSSEVTVSSTNISSGENVKGIIDESRPVTITFSGDIHPTYNSVQNVYLNNVRMDTTKLNFSVSGKTITLDFADNVLEDGADYTLELCGISDANGDTLSRKVFKVAASGEDKIIETWKLNKGTAENPDLLLFDGRVNGVIRGGFSVRNMGFAEKTYGVKLVSKKGDSVVSESTLSTISTVSGEMKEVYTELNVTEDVDVYLHVTDGLGKDLKNPLKITTVSVPESAMLIDDYWGDSWGEYFSYEVDGETKTYNAVMQSGWVFDYDGSTGTRPTYANNNYFILRDAETDGSIQGSKKFLSHQKGTVTLDFEIGSSVVMNGAEAAVTGYNGNTLVDIAKIEVIDGKICAYDGKTKVELDEFKAGAWYPCRTEIDMDNKTFDLYFLSKLVLDDASFYDAADTLSAFRMKTPDAMTGDLRLRYLYGHRGYLAYDIFANTNSSWDVPETWEKDGILQVTEVLSGRQNDTDSLLLGRTTNPDPGSISKDFGVLEDNIDIFFRFKVTGSRHFSVALKGINDYYVFGFDIYGTTMYFDGNKVATETINPNVWNDAKFVLNVDDSTMEFYLNNRLMGSKPFAFADSVLGIKFEGEGGQILDDVRISKIDKTTTVIDESQIPADDGIDVHMIVYPMWREGSHFGWDRLVGYPERKPYLGYYDSGNVEATNMQIKWMVEHGVDGFAIPFSRAVGNNGYNVRISNRFETLHDGYFNSPYRDLIDFCILYSGISSSSLKSVSDFKNNIVPFWIEHYFKHDNYAKTQSGQAVFYMYTMDSFYSVMEGIVLDGKSLDARIQEYVDSGKTADDAKKLAQEDIKTETSAKMKDCFDYLEEQVMAITDSEGNPKYTGLYVSFVGETTMTANYTKAAECGADALFRYGEAQSAFTKVTQLRRYNYAVEAQKLSGSETDYVPGGYMGYQRHPWGSGTSGGFLEPHELEEILNEIKTDILAGEVSPEKIVTLGCWDEFGEGHYLMPAEIHGFGYMDAVRNVFGDGSAHTDVKPDALEQRRFGWFYQNDGTAYNSYEWPDESLDGSRPIVKGWYFNDYTSADITGSTSKGFKIGDSGWTVYNAASCEIVDGSLKITATANGNAPHLDYGYADTNDKYTDINTGECAKFTVSATSNVLNSKGDYGLIYFSTKYTLEDLGYKFMQTDAAGACIVDPHRWNIFRDGYQDVTLSSNTYWMVDSPVKKIRYWPAYYGSGQYATAETLVVSIDSIEFLGNIAQ